MKWIHGRFNVSWEQAVGYHGGFQKENLVPSHCWHVKTVEETLICNPLELSVGHFKFSQKKMI